jgi:DNA repair exonuclease SbcCD nuclease subunit
MPGSQSLLAATQNCSEWFINPKSAICNLKLPFVVSPLSATLPGQGCLSQPRESELGLRERREVLMPGQHFRFLHAGDFALDEPIVALPEAPQSLRDLVIDAPYLAAERVVRTAIEERVDFVVLSGNLVNLKRATPRALAFLLDQFQRLDAHGIAVYWAGGKHDPPQDWPAIARLPGSVQVFSSLEPEELSHFRGDRPVANLVGRSWHGTSLPHLGNLASDSDGLTTVVVACGQADSDSLVEQEVDYWALGGQPQRQSLGSTHRIVHYPGNPQGRSLAECGPHGCTLVHVAGDRSLRTQFVATDMVRWASESIKVEEGGTHGDVQRQLAERVKLLRSHAEERPLLVQWKLRGIEHLARPTRRHELAAELLAWLRKEFGPAKPPLWSVEVELENSTLPGEWQTEDSMVGDYLRSLKLLMDADPREIDLTEHIPEAFRTAELAGLRSWSADDHREILRDAALAGAHLLGADDRD